jgi:hypothetical protein
VKAFPSGQISQLLTLIYKNNREPLVGIVDCDQQARTSSNSTSGATISMKSQLQSAKENTGFVIISSII